MMHFFEDLHDVTLIRRAQAGDAGAAATLIEHHQRVLYAVAMSLLGDATDARMAAVSALRGAHELLATPDPGYGFFSSALRLLVHDCLHALSTAQRRRWPEAAAGRAMITHRLSVAQRRFVTRAAVLSLEPWHRVVVVLKHVAGLSYEEVAIILDLTIAEVRTRLHAARQQVGEHLLAWTGRESLDAGDDAVLQDAIDRAHAHPARAAFVRLLSSHVQAPARAAAFAELGRLLNSLALTDPPTNLTHHVLDHAAPAVSA